MPQLLPNEILDRILDYRHDDYRTLAACALSSRVLLQTSRFHRFSGRFIEQLDARTLVPLLVASPTLAQAIVSLKYTRRSLEPPTPPEKLLFQQLPALRELTIGLDAVPLLASVIPTLTVLRLRGSWTHESTTVGEVLAELALPPSLEELELIEVRLRYDDLSKIQYSPAIRLRKVCVTGGNSASAIYQWLRPISPQPLYSVRHLVMAARDAANFVELSETLAPITQDLELQFIPDGSMADALGKSPFSLSPFTTIHSCVLRFAFSEMCVRENQSLAWIPNIVAQLSSSYLRSLTISLVVDNVEDLRSLSSECAVRVLSTAYFDDMRVVDWVIMEMALSSERLPGLQRIVLEGRGSRQALEDHIKITCPQLHARGILSLVTVKEEATWLKLP